MGYSIFDETMVDMPWPEVEKAAKQGAIVLLPTGVIEEHGPHMDLGVDTYCSYLLCRKTREELEKRGIRTLIAPPYYWGINNATGSFPGSFTVRRETLINLLYDIFASLRRWGFTYAFIINVHGDHEHNVAIMDATKEARINTGIRAYYTLTDVQARRFGIKGNEPYVIIRETPDEPAPKYYQVHAGGPETSKYAYYFPRQLNVALAKKLKPTNTTFEDLQVWRCGWSEAKEITPLGYMGNPASFDPEIGRKLVEDDSLDLSILIENFLEGNYNSPKI